MLNINKERTGNKTMGVNLSKTEEQLTNEVMSKINLSKDQQKFKGTVVNLSKTIVNLSKSSGVDLGATKAQVVVVLDYSGSMQGRYENGTVQQVIDKMVPLGITFDDNGSVEVFRFANGIDFMQFESLTIKNYEGYVKKYIMTGDMGGTDYAPVLKEIKRLYIDGECEDNSNKKAKKGFLGLFGHKTSQKEVKASGKVKTLTGADAAVNPLFVIFITDGDNFDKRDTDDIIRKLSKEYCFIQFIGVGNDRMSYLEKLDNLTGRECDNTGFTRFDDIKNISDTQLYEAVLGNFADWLKVKGF